RYKRKLQFSAACPEEGYRFDKGELLCLLAFRRFTTSFVNSVLNGALFFHPPTETGNFLCLVPTGKECFELCQQHHCNEWSAFNFMYSKDTRIRRRYACRCVRPFNMCLYNYVR
ncbi:unnamed protein product, partial [Dibothriocephalus latus]